MMVAYVLWVLALLTLTVGQQAADLHRAVVEERLATRRSELRAAAVSGLAAFRTGLATQANGEYSYLAEPFRRDPSGSVFQMGPEVRTIAYVVQDTLASPEGQLAFGARDEESRLNLLKADPIYVAVLPGVTEAMAQNLATLVARRQAPQSLGSLWEVPGWEGVNLASLGGLVTFWGDGKINVNTAPAEVLRLLGLTDRAVQAMVRFRAGPDRTRGTGDDRFFKGLDEIVPRLLESGVEVDAASEWAALLPKDLLTVRSRYYRVAVRAADGETGEEYEIGAVVRADSLATIMAWREARPQ
jgi:hypothetical protein